MHLMTRYPLDLERPAAVFVFEAPCGLCMADVVRCTVAMYHIIYAAEEAAVGPVLGQGGGTPCDRARKSRDVKTGPYGIWGHALCDLVLEGGFIYVPFSSDDGEVLGPPWLQPLVGS